MHPVLHTQLTPLSQSSDPISISSAHSTHAMVNRSKDGITKPNPKYLYTAETLPVEPKIVKSALRHPGWVSAMQDELDALHHNNTWDLVPRPSNTNVVECKWIFKTKLKSDATLNRLKAHLVAKGFNQVLTVEFVETFSSVIKPSTICVVLTSALTNNWGICELDVNNAFLYGRFVVPVFMEHLPGFKDPLQLNHVCWLKRGLVWSTSSTAGLV